MRSIIMEIDCMLRDWRVSNYHGGYEVYVRYLTVDTKQDG